MTRPVRAAYDLIFASMSSSIVQAPVRRRHSAEVQMELRLEGRVLRLAQIGPDFLILKAPIDCPPCLATLWISIDGREHENKVRIPNGMRADSRKVEIALP